jgi:hypothetical protein
LLCVRKMLHTWRTVPIISSMLPRRALVERDLSEGLLAIPLYGTAERGG